MQATFHRLRQRNPEVEKIGGLHRQVSYLEGSDFPTGFDKGELALQDTPNEKGRSS